MMGLDDDTGVPGRVGGADDSPGNRPSDSSPADIGQLRAQYSDAELNRQDLDADPLRQFDRWFQQAREADLPEPNAMALATAGSDGIPTIRVVLLKAYDERGFVFFTNYQSAKARQISANARVAMNFLWHPLQRQVNITGVAQKIGSAESLKYFLSRPRGSQLGAWISNQSAVISSRQILRMKFEEVKRKFRAGEVPLPDHWGGYRVKPDSLEFWQGRPNRLHDRFRYLRDEADQQWVIERLAP